LRPLLPPPPTSPLSPYTTLFRSGLPGAPVLVVEVDGCGVFPTDGDAAHHAPPSVSRLSRRHCTIETCGPAAHSPQLPRGSRGERDRQSTRLNSSHQIISYAVFCV